MPDAAKPTSVVQSDPTSADAKPRWWKSLLTPRWLIVFVLVSLVIHSVLFVLVRRMTSHPTFPPEYTVGSFTILTEAPGDSHAQPAKFDLHVRFIEDLEAPANSRIAKHQFRVREAIENLLRKSHGIELDDPAFARLKHQIEEQINQAIDLRAVAEVMITNLNIELPPLDNNLTSTPAAKEHSTVPTSADEDRLQSDSEQHRNG